MCKYACYPSITAQVLVNSQGLQGQFSNLYFTRTNYSSLCNYLSSGYFPDDVYNKNKIEGQSTKLSLFFLDNSGETLMGKRIKIVLERVCEFLTVL